MNDEKWYLRTQEETFGPVTKEKLVSWAKLGRIQPGQEVSDDNEIWTKVEEVAFLDMRFSIDIGDGVPRGPFNRAAAEALLASGRLPKTTTIVEVRAPFEQEEKSQAPMEETPAAPVESVQEAGEQPKEEKLKPSVTQMIENVVEAPVERVVEKIVEVPVERVVEKIVEVPVDRIVEVPVEKIVVDEAKVNELTAENNQLRDQIAILEGKLKNATERDQKQVEQIEHLEDDIRRLPAAASEVAEIQAAVYGIMCEENAEIQEIIETEKKEFEEFKRRHMDRADRLLERRRTLLKKAGANIEDMTRRALQARPEDPRTIQLRKEFDELKRSHEKTELDMTVKIRSLEEELRVRRAEEARMSESMKDITQLRQEIELLREKLQRAEQDLMVEREKSEKMRQSAALRQQTMLARLASLESPSIGTTDSMATNQSREAKLVKLPSWMKIRK